MTGRLAALTTLPGVGPARAEKLEKLGVRDVRDLMLFVPQRVEVWGERLSIEAACAVKNEMVTVTGRVDKVRLNRMGYRRSVLRVTLLDDSGTIDALFFNQPWQRERFPLGHEVELAGRVVDSKGPALASPRIGTSDNPLPPPGTLLPVYPTTEGIAQALLRKMCRVAAERHLDELVEPLPAEFLEARGIPTIANAVRALHWPASAEDFHGGHRRLKLEPLLRMLARIRELRQNRLRARAFEVAIDDAAHAELLARLPFKPTPGQLAAIEDVRRDVRGPAPMRRLVQGDVGSGKTLVALYGCLAVARAGAQCAFLAPTELLAEQHYDGLRGRLEEAGLSSVLLTGSLPAGERRAVLAQLESGMADIAFGTHSLFSKDVRYKNLALGVIDEQHRFGVDQRARLFDKGRDVHALLTTATPIPRTLALTLYGDLDVSVVADMPPGRGDVRTRWIRGNDKRRLPKFLGERLAEGERVYWVVPRIGSDEDEGEGPSAERAFERLSRSKVGRFGVELVHGRLPAAERAQRLERFRRGEVAVLVATTVIEVGVDVAEATVLVVESAERLGLAQLHQLRGRVGRGPRDSWCLLAGEPVAKERFLFLESTRDGFEIAEEDLRQRGMGDLTGVRQAGENAEGLAELDTDLDLYFIARDLLGVHPEVLDLYADAGSSAVTP